MAAAHEISALLMSNYAMFDFDKIRSLRGKCQCNCQSSIENEKLADIGDLYPDVNEVRFDLKQVEDEAIIPRNFKEINEIFSPFISKLPSQKILPEHEKLIVNRFKREIVDYYRTNEPLGKWSVTEYFSVFTIKPNVYELLAKSDLFQVN